MKTEPSIDTKGGLYPWFVIAVLLFAYIFSFVDRQIVSLIVAPLRSDLGLSDGQIGLLQGLSFALFYSVLGIPLGFAADRYNRRNIIVCGVMLWGVATAASGLAETYSQLLAARVLTGVGEAALSPAAYSLIADYFRPAQRGRALSIYVSGAYIGLGFAYIAGGVASGSMLHLVGGLAEYGIAATPWQALFFLAGAPTPIIVALVLMIKEPPREQSTVAEGLSRHGFAETLRFLSNNRFIFALVGVISCLCSAASTAFFAWLPTAFLRSFGWSVADSAPRLGVVIILCGVGGLASAGWFSDRLARVGRHDGALLIGLGGIALGIPSCGLLFTSAPQEMSVLLVGLAMYAFALLTVMPWILIQNIAPNEFRGAIIAMFLLAVNVFGLGPGPSLIVAVSDLLSADGSRLGLSLSIVTPLLLALAGLLMILLRQHLYDEGAMRLAPRAGAFSPNRESMR